MLISTLYIVVLTLVIVTPVGLSSAIYLTQYAKQGRLVRVIRFATEVLSGVPACSATPCSAICWGSALRSWRAA